jgi:hypothetical protein
MRRTREQVRWAIILSETWKMGLFAVGIIVAGCLAMIFYPI